jgi:hypothetical protein
LLVARADLGQVRYPAAGILTSGSGGQYIRLATPATELRYDSLYPAVDRGGDTLTLAFTQLPLVHLHTEAELDEWWKRPGRFTYADDERTVRSHIGLRHRGSFSLRYPKKSLDIEFWDAAEGRNSRDVQFSNLREDDDWVLDALYNEPLRVNAYVAHQLWLDLHAPYYRDRESDARAGADQLFVEAFYNGKYHGLYLLSEQVDRKQLKLKKVKDGKIRGELYKAVDWTNATRLLAPLDLPPAGSAPHYDGWELKHPEPEDGIGWGPLHALIRFATQSSDDDFRRQASEYFALDNLIDYFLYVNATALIDNTGKNSYLARYHQGEPYFYVPWDLDASFGNRYDATRNLDPENWLTNGLLDRLLELQPDDYGERFCTRYRELREGLFHPDTLSSRIEAAVAYLERNGAYRREAMAWPGSVDASTEYRSFVRGWNERRIRFLDRAVCEGLVSAVEPPRIRESIRVFPNPVVSDLTVEREDGRAAEYVIYDVSGREVRRGSVRGPSDRISVRGMAAGMYALRISDQTHRFLVHP